MHLEVLLDPRQPPTSLKVSLRAGALADGQGDSAGRARITTRKRNGVTAPAELEAAGEHWVLLSGDPGLHPKRNQIRSCAALWLPGQVGRADCRDAGEGHTTVELTARPDLDRVRMSLLDLRGSDPPANPDGLAPVFSEAAKLLEGAAFDDVVPRSFPSPEARAETDRLLGRLKDKGEFASRVAYLRRRVEQETAALAEGGPGAWVAQHRLSAYVTRHEDLVWDLRFAVLEQ